MISEATRVIFSEAGSAIEEIREDKEFGGGKLAAFLDIASKALQKAGKVLISGGVPVFVGPEGYVITLLPGNAEYDEILLALSFLPGMNREFDKGLMRYLLATGFPKAEAIGIAKYLPHEHVLLLNEWGGSFLRVGPDGVVSRHPNGTDGYLFEQGNAPHRTNLEAVNCYRGPALTWDEDSPLIKHVFSVGIYANDSGVGRQAAIDVLLYWTLAGLLPERIKAQPILHLHGLSGTRKTAMAVALGWVIGADGLSFHAVAAPDDRTALETTLICAKGLIVLDEANNMRAIFNVLKALVTTAVLERRVLYTTATIQRFVIRLLAILTTNNLEISEESVALRVLKLDMGDPQGVTVQYRGDAAVEREWREGNLREACWQDLVCRLSAVMRLLSEARGKGTDEPTVTERMSGFWSFVTAVAQQEGLATVTRQKAAMVAIKAEQSRSVSTADDLFPLLHRWLTDSPDCQRRKLSAGQIASGILSYPNVSAEMVRLIGSSLRLSNKLTASSEYIRLLGLKTFNGRTKLFWFDLPEGMEPPPDDDPYRINVRHLGRQCPPGKA